jgi:DNA-binding NtrC family response regulator
VRHFVQRFATQMERPVLQVSEDAMAALVRFDWPGNVRQLINVVQNMVILTEGDRIEPRHLPAEIRGAAAVEAGAGADPPGGMSLDQIEKQAIRNTLRLTGGNREQAARMLGIGERTLYRKLKEYGLK